VKPEVARRQIDVESAKPDPPPSAEDDGSRGSAPGAEGGAPGTDVIDDGSTHPRRFHGTVVLDESRVGRDAGRIAEEVIAHLTGLVGTKVTVTLEVEAEIPAGVPDHVVRTVTENSRTLKFTSQGFEKE